MRSLLVGTCLLPFALALPGQTAAPAATKLGDAEYARLLREVAPAPDAPWRTVAWRTDLLAAQREAAAADKPLFVWAMDGHPLTCV